MKFRILLLTSGLILAAVCGHADFAESIHTRYDENLGWVNLPGVHIPDMYGPGLYLRTNSRGFRNDREFSEKVPPGKRRMVCSGDSFALGYGVGQNETWCAQIEQFNPALETVNMGQGGYGVDQSYLWFIRDGTRLDFDAHLFTFTFTDFERMKYSSFFGYQKPLLAVENGKLFAKKAGPPDPDFKLSKITRFRIWLHRFEWVRALEEVGRRHFLRVEDEKVKEIVPKIFESLKAVNASKDSRLIVVYLPTPFDREKTLLDELRAYLKEELLHQKIEFFDPTEKFRALGSAEFKSMFLSADEVNFAGAEGHYSKKGNRWMAGLLQELIG